MPRACLRAIGFRDMRLLYRRLVVMRVAHQYNCLRTSLVLNKSGSFVCPGFGYVISQEPEVPVFALYFHFHHTIVDEFPGTTSETEVQQCPPVSEKARHQAITIPLPSPSACEYLVLDALLPTPLVLGTSCSVTFTIAHFPKQPACPRACLYTLNPIRLRATASYLILGRVPNVPYLHSLKDRRPILAHSTGFVSVDSSVSFPGTQVCRETALLSQTTLACRTT